MTKILMQYLQKKKGRIVTTRSPKADSAEIFQERQTFQVAAKNFLAHERKIHALIIQYIIKECDLYKK